MHLDGLVELRKLYMSKYSEQRGILVLMSAVLCKGLAHICRDSRNLLGAHPSNVFQITFSSVYFFNSILITMFLVGGSKTHV